MTGLAMGIVYFKSDTTDPAAMLTIIDTTTGVAQEVLVRTGDKIIVGRRTVHVTGIFYGVDAQVDLTVSGGVAVEWAESE